jgi:hypothetical protein
MKIACGESAIKGDGIGDVHVALIAEHEVRVYVNAGTLPSGEEDKRFYALHTALEYATAVARHITELYVEENPL